ncbi:AcvB/VirJ family lysyl-phosphatidylglycerol hydrolase [Desulfospira joergensenii]|uniref:AcvB/VirJ family lysyl-phosphatidylglycerol hydrolase n=1 Tax=Desulfospira joergensenii TaxID=53329 RepID=UPI001377C68B|nr:AcvB/VirJ family lysyl-phosphatidylglycerol hydrolase [Desulfospira joergensenii]
MVWIPGVDAAASPEHRLDRGDTPRIPSLSRDDLPLEEISSEPSRGDTLAVLLSGDGGWASLARTVGSGLAREGIPVAGLNSLSYFWTRRSPDRAARDLERIITRYRKLWHKGKVLLLGYFFGADTLPFMITRLSDPAKACVTGVVLISPTYQADFEIHVMEHLGWQSPDPDYPVLPELKKLRDYPVLCMAGAEEENCLCRDQSLPWIKTVLFPGGHHLGGDSEGIVNTILSNLFMKEVQP